MTVKNPQRDFSIFVFFSDEFDIKTGYERARTYTYEIPATGDYQFFVRKKMARSSRTARFRITLEIERSSRVTVAQGCPRVCITKILADNSSSTNYYQEK